MLLKEKYNKSVHTPLRLALLVEESNSPMLLLYFISADRGDRTPETEFRVSFSTIYPHILLLSKDIKFISIYQII